MDKGWDSIPGEEGLFLVTENRQLEHDGGRPNREGT
jgi:hypothetical protein